MIKCPCISFLSRLALLFTLLWPITSLSQTTPTQKTEKTEKDCTAITWENLAKTVHETFQNGPGQRAILLEQGARKAERAVSGRLQSLEISANSEFPLGNDTWTDRDLGIDAALNIQLGSLTKTLQLAWQAEARVDHADANAEHWQFAGEVLSAYLESWVQAAVALQTQENLAAALTELEPLRTAADQQHISRLDLLDLEVELGRLTAELAETRRQAHVANTRLAHLLGQSCVRIDDDELTVDDLAPDHPLLAENPWTPLLNQLHTHPLVQSSQAHAHFASQQAEAARKAAPWELSLAAGFYTSAFDIFWPTAEIGLVIPLTNPDAADAERFQALAAAHRAEARWQLRQAHAQLEGFHNRYDAAATQQQSMQTTWLAPLIERQNLLETAFQQRQVSLERVIRGRRELIEARKTTFLVTAELLVATRRAQLLHTLMTSLSAEINTEHNP